MLCTKNCLLLLTFHQKHWLPKQFLHSSPKRIIFTCRIVTPFILLYSILTNCGVIFGWIWGKHKSKWSILVFWIVIYTHETTKIHNTMMKFYSKSSKTLIIQNNYKKLQIFIQFQSKYAHSRAILGYKWLKLSHNQLNFSIFMQKV